MRINDPLLEKSTWCKRCACTGEAQDGQKQSARRRLGAQGVTEIRERCEAGNTFLHFVVFLMERTMGTINLEELQEIGRYTLLMKW